MRKIIYFSLEDAIYRGLQDADLAWSKGYETESKVSYVAKRVKKYLTQINKEKKRKIKK